MAARAQTLAMRTRAVPTPTPGIRPSTRAAIGKAGKNRTDCTPEAA